MNQYKKMFRMQYTYYIVVGLFLIVPIIAMMNNMHMLEINLHYDAYIKVINGYWNDSVNQRVGMEISSQVVEGIIGYIYYLNWIVIIGIFVMNMLRAVNRINRKTIEFVAVLPIKRASQTIFDLCMDSIFVVLIYGIVYIYERITISGHELFRAYSEDLMLGIGRMLFILILSDMFIIVMFKLLEVVMTNGMVACFVTVFNYFSLNFILVDILGEYNDVLYNNAVRVFFPLNEYWRNTDGGYVMNTTYSMESNYFLKIVATLVIAIAVLVFISLYYSRKVDCSRSGWFCFTLPRYINLGIVIVLMIIYIVETFMWDYDSLLKVNLVIACVIGLFVLNYFISPKRNRAKLTRKGD